MSSKLYNSFIRDAIKNEGIEVADKANKLALAQQAITIDQYLKAAHIIVDAYREAHRN